MVRFLRYFAAPAVIGGAIGLAALALINLSSAPARSDGYADAVDRAAPAVVNIQSIKIVLKHRHPICQMPRFRDLCERQGASRPELQRSLGSGVVVREDGYILTNAHVIGALRAPDNSAADEILVSFVDGQNARAAVVGVDPETDLAVIKVEATGLPAIELASSADARVGDMVLAIGNPFGIGQTVSLGIISAKSRHSISPIPSPYDDFIQTDAAVHPGNSGGALIDTRGNLVGINTLIFSQSGVSEGIGFAIPSDLALEVMDEIIQFGRVERGWLGFGVSSEIRAPENVEVRCIGKDSPAQRAGIEIGDLVTHIDDQRVTSDRDVTHQIAMARPGSILEISLDRQGDAVTVRAQAGLRPPPSQVSSLCE